MNKEMIKEGELSVGDWILYKEKPFIVERIAEKEGGCHSVVIHKGLKEIILGFECIKPVQLTWRMLKRLGFKKVGEGLTYFKENIAVKPPIPEWDYHIGGMFVCTDKENKRSSVSVKFVDGIFVHDFQRLLRMTCHSDIADSIEPTRMDMIVDNKESV